MTATTHMSRPSIRFSVVMLLVMSGLAMATTQMTSIPTASANGSDPVALCGGPLAPNNPVGANLFRVLAKDASTSRAVTGSALVLVNASNPQIQALGSMTSSCDQVSEFNLAALPVDFGFQLGVVSPDGFASQWYPSGDRARATVFRKRADNQVEARAFGSSTWTPVTQTIEASLARGNSVPVSLTGNAASLVANRTCLVVWVVAADGITLEYGGASCNDSASSPTDIIVKGIAFGVSFILELRNSQYSNVNPKGYLKSSGGSWELVRSWGEASVFTSEAAGQGVKLGQSVVGSIALNIPMTRSISGVVRDGQGNPVNDVCIFVLEKDRFFRGESADDAIQCFLTNGFWDVGGLTGSEYLVYVGDAGAGIINGFYGPSGGTTPNGFSATSFTFGANVSTSAGVVTVQRGSLVTGTISRPSGSYDVCVAAWKESEPGGFRERVNGTCTRSNTFSLAVPDGDYRFEYYERDGLLKTVWNGGAASFAAAQDVSVAGATTLASVTMTVGASVTGDLNLAGSGSFLGVCVSAFDGSGNDFDWGEWISGTCSISATGGFTLGGFSPGARIKLRIDSSNGSHRSAFYSSTGPVYKNSEAEVVTVQPSTVLSPVTLAAGNSIAGKITSDGTNPVQFACVSAISSSWEWLGGVCTGNDGSYTLSGLPADPNMRVWIQGPRSSPTLGGGWLLGLAGSWTVTNSAQSINVSSALTDVDVTLRPARQITGTVTTSAGVAPPSTCVSAFSASDFQWMGRACTNRESKYTIGGLPTNASFVLLVEPQQSSGYRSGWLESATSVTTSATASLLTVSSFSNSSATQDIELASPPSGKIIGVAELSGQGLVGLLVVAKVAGSAPTSSALALTTTGVGGSFTLSGLNPGTTYDVYIVDLQATPRINPFVGPFQAIATSAQPWKPTLTGVNS